jgi:hypothetical protein
MDDKLDFRLMFAESRARVYLLWALLTAIGFTATHYYQNPNINGVWFVIAVIGLGYMFRVMPLKVKQMQHIYLSWLVPITAGIIVSGLAVHTSAFAGLVPYLGAYWLGIMAIGYFWNGTFDPPGTWYYVIAAVNAAAGLACYVSNDFTTAQYLVAAIISAWSMLSLWIFRSDA